MVYSVDSFCDLLMISGLWVFGKCTDAYFRRTGLERCESLEKDLQWFTAQDLVIPEPSQIGVSYAKYLEDQARESAPLFLSHFYNIYFSHIAGGQVIVRQVNFLMIYYLISVHKGT